MRKRNVWQSMIVVLVLSMLVVSCTPQQATPPATAQQTEAPTTAGGSGDTILIGGALCLTGIQSPLDEPAVRGAQLAVDLINQKGGVLGRPLEFKNLDGKSDPVTVGNAAIQLISGRRRRNRHAERFRLRRPGCPRGAKSRTGWHFPGRFVAVVWLEDFRRFAVPNVDVEHHDGCGDRRVRIQYQRLAQGLRCNRYLYRLHQITQSIFHRGIQALWREISLKTLTSRATRISPLNSPVSKPCRSSPILYSSRHICRIRHDHPHAPRKWHKRADRWGRFRMTIQRSFRL